MGAPARPWLRTLEPAPLVLEIQDVRTEEEKERDLQRAAEALTQPMFTEGILDEQAQEPPSLSSEYSATKSPQPAPPTLTVRPASRRAEGLRARLRREHIPVRTRHSDPQAQGLVPTLWMEREYIQKRLPYLVDGLPRLDEKQITALTEGVSEVLQHTYWTILGLVLSQSLDAGQGAKAS